MTRIPASTTYGDQARAVPITWRGCAVSGLRSPIQFSNQVLRSPNPHGSFGWRNPARVAVITIASPISPPKSDGNSGPSSQAVSQ